MLLNPISFPSLTFIERIFEFYPLEFLLSLLRGIPANADGVTFLEPLLLSLNLAVAYGSLLTCIISKYEARF